MEYQKSLKIGDPVTWKGLDRNKREVIVTGYVFERVRAKTRPAEGGAHCVGKSSKRDVSYVVSNGKKHWIEISQIIVPPEVKASSAKLQNEEKPVKPASAKPGVQEHVTSSAKSAVKPSTKLNAQIDKVAAKIVESITPSRTKTKSSTARAITASPSVKVTPDDGKQVRIMPDVFRKTFDALAAYRRPYVKL